MADNIIDVSDAPIEEEQLEENAGKAAPAPAERRVKEEEVKPAGRRTTPSYKVTKKATEE